MKKYFNTAGPCNPAEHYMIPAESRCRGLSELMDRKQYFVIHAARQSGKTTLLKEVSAAREGYPTARTIDVMFVDESGLFFLTGRGKSFYRQLKALQYGGDCAFPRGGVNPRQEPSNRAN